MRRDEAPTSRHLTTVDVANYCGVDYRTVIRWIDKGLLEAFRLPGRGDRRVTAQAFVEFCRRNEMPVPAELTDDSPHALVVDDDADIAALIAELLRRVGISSCSAMNGFEAGSLLASFRPRLVTMDLRMPGLGGLDVIRSIRAKSDWKDVMILVVSGMEASDLEEARRAGADGILTKPFTNHQLYEAVESICPGLMTSPPPTRAVD